MSDREWKAGDKVRFDKSYNPTENITIFAGAEYEVARFEGAQSWNTFPGLGTYVFLVTKGGWAPYTTPEGVRFFLAPADILTVIEPAVEQHRCHCPIENFTLTGPGCQCGGI